VINLSCGKSYVPKVLKINLIVNTENKRYLDINPSNPKYLEWYSLFLDVEHTIQVCRGEWVKNIPEFIDTKILTRTLASIMYEIQA